MVNAEVSPWMQMDENCKPKTTFIEIKEEFSETKISETFNNSQQLDVDVILGAATKSAHHMW